MRWKRATKYSIVSDCGYSIAKTFHSGVAKYSTFTPKPNADIHGHEPPRKASQYHLAIIVTEDLNEAKQAAEKHHANQTS